MPDKLVEFMNGTYTYDELVVGVPIVTNGEHEEATVKEIKVIAGSSESLYNYSVNINDFGVIENLPSGANTHLDGYELVSENSTMELKTYDLDTEILNSFREYKAITSYLQSDITPSIFPLVDWSDTSMARTTIGIPATGTQAPVAVYHMANGDIWWSTYIGTILNRRLGGWDGVNEQISTCNSEVAHCFDKDNRIIYGVYLGNLRFINCDTLVVTEIPLTGDSLGTLIAVNSSTHFIDGYVFLRGGSSNQYNIIIDVATGVCTELGAFIVSFTAQLPLKVTKDSSGDYICVNRLPAAPWFSWTNYGNDLSTPYIKDEGYFNDTATDVAIGTYPDSLFVGDGTPYIYFTTAAPLYILNVDTKICEEVTMSAAASVLGVKYVIPDAVRFATDKAAFYGSISVRATGIKTTLGA